MNAANKADETPSSTLRHGLIGAVIIISFCALFLELLYPKIFYFVKVLPGFEMVLVAINMLGVALGALLSFYLRGSQKLLLWAALLFAPAVFASFVACVALTNHLAIIGALTVPFFLAAIVIGQAFIMGRPSWVYAASLIGSGLGVLAIFFLLRPLGGESCMILACALGALAPLMTWKTSRRFGTAAIAMALAFSALLAYQLSTDRLNLIRIFPRSFRYPGRVAQVGSDAIKLADAELMASAWSLISRIDVIRVEHSQLAICFPNGIDHLPDSDLNREIRETYWTDVNLYYNNEAFTAMARRPRLKSALPYAILDRPAVLVIGTGGGQDLAKALGADAKKIVGVEINPDTVTLMSGKFAEMNGNVYNRAQIHTMDGRTFIHRSREKFDLINLMFAELYIAFPNSQVFIENYLYTAEAFDEYIEHLTDNGILFVSKPLIYSADGHMDQMLRVLATAYEALERAGVEDPRRHIWFGSMACEPDYLQGGHLLVKKSPFTEKELDILRGVMIEPFSVLYEPGAENIDTAVSRFLAAEDKAVFYEEYPKYVAPCTDNRPFFYVFDRDYKLQLHFFKIFLAAIFALNFLPLGAVIAATGRIRRKGYPRALSIFALLGMAYMLTQAVAVQKLNVFLGSPSYSLAVVIGCFLVMGAAGSALNARLSWRVFRALALMIPAAMALAYLGFELVTDAFFGASLGMRVAAALALLTPLSVLLGIPFPRALETAKSMLGDREAALLYGVDSSFAVLAVVSSIMLSILLGFNLVFALAGALYLATALLLAGWRRD